MTDSKEHPRLIPLCWPRQASHLWSSASRVPGTFRILYRALPCWAFNQRHYLHRKLAQKHVREDMMLPVLVISDGRWKPTHAIRDGQNCIMPDIINMHRRVEKCLPYIATWHLPCTVTFTVHCYMKFSNRMMITLGKHGQGSNKVFAIILSDRIMAVLVFCLVSL